MKKRGMKKRIERKKEGKRADKKTLKAKNEKKALFSGRELVWIGIAAIFGIISFVFLDNTVAYMLQSFKYGWLTAILSIFKPMYMIAVFGVFTLLLLWKSRRKELALPFAISLIVSAALSFVLKFIFMRERPFGLIEYIDFTSVKDYSFPSSHTMAIFAGIPILRRSTWGIKFLWITLAVITSVSRLYFSAHFLSDVIFGAVFGYIAGKIMIPAFSALRKE